MNVGPISTLLQASLNSSVEYFGCGMLHYTSFVCLMFGAGQVVYIGFIQAFMSAAAGNEVDTNSESEPKQ